MEPIIILCFSPWIPYLKRDRNSLPILFFIMDPRHCSMKILWNDSIKKNDGIDVRHSANGSSSWHVRKVEVVSLVCDF